MLLIHRLFSGERQDTQQIISNNLIFITPLPTKRPEEGFKNYEKRLNKLYDVSVLDYYLGPKINKTLNENGEKINFFISNTKNLSEFYQSLNEGVFLILKSIIH